MTRTLSEMKFGPAAIEVAGQKIFRAHEGGETARRVVRIFPKPDRKAQAAVGMVLAVACVVGLGGCASPVADAWSFYDANYDRALSVATSTDGKPQVSYTIKPKQQAVLSDAQVKELMAHFSEYATRDGKSVIKAEATK